MKTTYLFTRTKKKIKMWLQYLFLCGKNAEIFERKIY
jgi:hypothetical protein